MKRSAKHLAAVLCLLLGLSTSSEAVVWTQHESSHGSVVACCIYPTRGDINMDGTIDLRDLSRLICYLGGCVLPPETPSWLPCVPAANVNGMGIIDLGDLSLLIAYLTSTPRPTLPPCGP